MITLCKLLVLLIINVKHISVETATNFAQSQNQLTNSIVLPCIKGLTAELSELQGKSNCKFIKTLAYCVARCLSQHENRSHHYLCCSWSMLETQVSYYWRGAQSSDFGWWSSHPPPTQSWESHFICHLYSPTPTCQTVQVIHVYKKTFHKSIIFQPEQDAPSAELQVDKYLSLPCLAEYDDPLQY